MAAANFEDVKRKYNFSQISVATWRDPSLSVHPARGGPNPSATTPEQPYFPTYRVNYDLLSEQNDDDDDDNDGIDSQSTDCSDADEDDLECMQYLLTYYIKY